MRKIWDIHGGIHPQENKQQSNQQPISFAGIPDELIYPLSQHIGTPATPIVTVGQQVLKGEMIAAAKGFVSVPVHASTSGTIIAIEDRLLPHPSGMSARCIVLRSDGKDQWVEHSGLADYQSVDRKELLNKIREAGIAGMGGAGFPSAVKLSTRADQPIETLIINGTECEPYITADDRLMQERAEQIIAGCKVLQYLINPTKETLIGIEDNKPEAIAALQQAATDSNITIVSFPTKYPSGGEKQLIQILTGKEVPTGGLPSQIAVVCQNIGTTVAIHRAIKFGEPLISRITTVTGDACQQQQNFEVLLGTPVNYLLKQCEFNQQQCSRLIMGGPMMGFTLENDSVPVVKTTNCILAPTAEEIAIPEPAQACIRCGMCAEACPVSLLPQQMYWFARAKEYDKLEAHHLMDCIECGACSYACPSNIPLVQYYRASKAEIRQNQLDAKKAEQSKARFEARQVRIEQQAIEKEAKRKARKAAAIARAAGNDGDKGDAIQAAIERAKTKKANTDPAQAAIEKAKAKRADGGDQKQSKEQLEKNLASIEKRLQVAKEKCLQAQQEGSENLDAFRKGLTKTEEKHQKAKQQLEQFIADNPEETVKATNSDPAQLAIERAKQKRASAEQLSPRQKAEHAVTTLKTRLQKASDKLAIAREEQSDKLEIFESSLATLQEKLVTAEQALIDIPAEKTTPANSTQETPPVNNDDIVARALAKREAASKMTDKERLQNAVSSIQKRLNKTQQKLVTAEQEGSDSAAILGETVSKLTLKLADAEQAFKDYQQQ